ncbi:MAG: glycosyltransferase family 4 protein [Thaumarchaeota archaeon]|nr:glycosyltransferase family 4 protein [Nitrososphaerota archaeon]
MNILLLSQFFSTTRGGGEYVFSIIAKKLAENNHKVWVITNKISNETYVNHKNINLVFVPPILEYRGGLPPGFLDNLRYTINAVRSGIRIIKKEQIDIIHSNNFAPALAGSILSYLTSKPHITAIHDVFSLCGRNYWKKWGDQANISKLNVALAPFFEKLMIKLKYDCIHTVSDATRDDLIKFGATRPIYVIHNSVEEIKKQNTEINRMQFVYVGRLVFYKNLEVVIKALQSIKEKMPQIKLIIVGSGPHKESLENLVKSLKLESHIEFKGYVSVEEKTDLISTSNALVFPSLCEGFGLVILEAFVQGRPVLVSNIRPMSDIITNMENGYVLDPHDEEVWADHLFKLIQEPGLADKMGQKGNQLLTAYSQDSMYQKIIQMYQNCKRISDK